MSILRITDSKKEIVNVLKRIQLEEEEVFIWQNHQGKRNIIYCKIEKVDPGMGNFSISPIDEAQSFQLEKKLSLYIKGEFESILFKQDVSFFTESLVILKIPSEIRIVEKRSISRKKFELSDQYKIVIAKYEKNSKKPRKFDLFLLDISLKGISFFVSPNQLLSFSAADQFYLLQLGEKKFSTPVTSTIKYISRFSSAADEVKGHRIGAQFEGDLPQDIIDSINKFGK